MVYYMSSVFIKYLPKDKLLFSLWKEARMAQYFYYCPEKLEQLTIADVANDINFMIMNGRDIDLTTYHGKLLYINITPDLIDVFNYDMHNGRGKAKRIINTIKKEELENVAVSYYKFF